MLGITVNTVDWITPHLTFSWEREIISNETSKDVIHIHVMREVLYLKKERERERSRVRGQNDIVRGTERNWEWSL